MTDTVNVPREALEKAVAVIQYLDPSLQDIGEAFFRDLVGSLAAAPKAEPVEADDFGDALLAFLFRHGLKVALDVSEIEALRQSAIRAQPEAPKVEQEPVGTAEVEVGRAVYLRIESLIALNPRPNTSEWSELTYLSYLTGCVEELGAFDGPTVHPAPASDELLEALEVIQDKLKFCTDEGPEGEGWLSKELDQAWDVVSDYINQHKGPQS